MRDNVKVKYESNKEKDELLVLHKRTHIIVPQSDCTGN